MKIMAFDVISDIFLFKVYQFFFDRFSVVQKYSSICNF